MVEIIEWPRCVLRPQQVSANIVPFSRSGGTSLGGVNPSVRSDLGYWAIDYTSIVMRPRHQAEWKVWNAIRSKLGGRSGLIALEVSSSRTAPYAGGSFEPSTSIPHDDGTLFSDASGYRQAAISVVAEGEATIGATVVRLRTVNAGDDLVGSRFSYQHALYEIASVLELDGDLWTVQVSPSIRAVIPAGVDLEFDAPTCLCRLAEDRSMDIQEDRTSRVSFPSVSFAEATDYWNRLALGLI